MWLKSLMNECIADIVKKTATNSNLIVNFIGNT